MHAGFCMRIPLTLVRLPRLYKNMPGFSRKNHDIHDCFGLLVVFSKDPSDNFHEVVLCRDSSALATSSLQEGENEHLCALGNLGRITDHHGHLNATKTEEHAGTNHLRPTDRHVDSPIHGTV
jgi:hypothetical protein